MPTALQERAAEPRALDEALRDAVAGRGSTVLLTGEAGRTFTRSMLTFRHRLQALRGEWVVAEEGLRGAAAVARRRLRAAAVTQVPRGPQRAARAHPAGLTGRQQEILELLGDGLTNAETAARLVLSARTVDHHVSAVLAKLGVTSRREAITAIRAGDAG